jgi:chromosome partitioning protein
MRVLAFASQKSGAGKTTLAGHVAIQARRAGVKSVALVDTDPEGSLADWCALREGETPKYARATLQELAARLDKLRQDGTELVIIDTPPALHGPIDPSIAAADLVAIPTRPCNHDLQAAGATVELVEGHGKPFVFVVNGTASDAELTPEVVLALAQHGTVATVTIPRHIAFVESMIDGRTVMELPAGEASPAPDVAALWEYLAKRLPKDDAATAAPRPTAAAPAPETAASVPAADPKSAADSKPPNPEALRRYPRFNYERPAKLKVADGEVDCIVHDISAGGSLIRVGRDIKVGETVTLVLDGIGRLPAEVRHREEDRAGLRFILDPKQQLGLVKNLSALVAKKS